MAERSQVVPAAQPAQAPVKRAPWWRLWVTPEIQARLRGLTLGAVGLFFVLGLLVISAPLSWKPHAQLGLGVLLGLCIALAVLEFVVTSVPFCALCRLPQTHVKKLIGGEFGTVCSDCVPLALVLLDGGKPGPCVLEALRTALSDVTRELEPTAPRELSRPLFSAAVALQPGPEGLRVVAFDALRALRPAAALEALGHIPEPERGVWERLNIAAALGQLERYEEALEVMEPLEAVELSPMDRGVLLNNRALFTVREDPGLSGEALARERARAEEGGRLLLEHCPEEVRDTYRFAVFTTQAVLALRAGEPREALRLLAEAEQGGQQQPAYWLQRGDALAALGEAEGARGAWLQAIEVGNPDLPEVREAHARLARS